MTTPEEFDRRRQALERSYDILRQPPEEPSQDWADEARQTLIDLADSDISRVVKLRVLIDTLRRQPPEVRQRLDDEARFVLQHTLPTTASDEGWVE